MSAAFVVPVVVVSGPVGVGKTTVARELSVILEHRGVAHTLVDLDELTYTFPRPDDDPFGERLALANLGAVWANAQAAGAANLILVRVIEQPEQLNAIEAVIADAEVTLVRLTASRDVLEARVDERERGSLAAWHRGRAHELARRLADQPADLIIDTDGRQVREIAAQLADAIDWATRPGTQHPIPGSG